jgi:hypothetical protein
MASVAGHVLFAVRKMRVDFTHHDDHIAGDPFCIFSSEARSSTWQ